MLYFRHQDQCVPAGKTIDVLDQGVMMEVEFDDGSKREFHPEDLFDIHGDQVFSKLEDGSWDFKGSNSTYDSLADAIDHWKIIINDPE